MNKIKKLAIAAALGLACAAGTANAHLVSFAWLDNGNGTVTIFGEHWHGDTYTPYSDNGGLTVDGVNYQWSGVLNNVDRDDLVKTGIYAWDGYHYSDWLTATMVVGNGVHTFFTGYNCCIDEMDVGPQTFTISGVTSVNAVPEPASAALIGLGLVGAAAIRRRRNSAA